MDHVIESIVNSNQDFDSKSIVEAILPDKGQSYSLDEINDIIHTFQDKVEEFQQKSNDHFDSILDKNTSEKLENLYRSLHKVQLDVMKLQCDIAFTKEQQHAVKQTCDNPLIRERRELISGEINLRRSLQQYKFEPMKEFFSRFSNHLQTAIETNRQVSLHQSSSFQQLFDWSIYHQTISLLRACGKAMIDLDLIERLYQSDVDIVSMSFKQPVDKMSYNNFIEFPDTFSFESQLEITLATDKKQDFKNLLSVQSLRTIFYSTSPLNHVMFEPELVRLRNITVECCRLLIDLNMNYIEAHLTEGVNIDKLNGGENATMLTTEEQTLPLYAFSPQEYITQIGQHLLTLRKQTEQFDSMDNTALKFGLMSLEQARDILTGITSFNTITEIMMRCIARHCIRSLLGRTSNSILSKLSSNGRRQLATDALYLDNVLEDLGLLDLSEPNVEKFKSLLKVQ